MQSVGTEFRGRLMKGSLHHEQVAVRRGFVCVFQAWCFRLSGDRDEDG